MIGRFARSSAAVAALLVLVLLVLFVPGALSGHGGLDRATRLQVRDFALSGGAPAAPWSEWAWNSTNNTAGVLELPAVNVSQGATVLIALTYNAVATTVSDSLMSTYSALVSIATCANVCQAIYIANVTSSGSDMVSVNGHGGDALSAVLLVANSRLRPVFVNATFPSDSNVSLNPSSSTASWPGIDAAYSVGFYHNWGSSPIAACPTGWSQVGYGAGATPDMVGCVSGKTTGASVTTIAPNSWQGGYVLLANATPAPTAPTLLRATGESSSEISVSWSNPNGTLVSDTVEWGTNCGSWVGSATIPPTNAYSITGLTSSYSYCVGVAASSPGGEGPVALLRASTLPGAVTDLSVTVSSPSSFLLVWANPPRVTGDVIFLGPSCPPNGTQLPIAASTSYNLTGLTPGATICAEVEAVNGSLSGAPSSAVGGILPGSSSARALLPSGLTLPLPELALADGVLVLVVLLAAWPYVRKKLLGQHVEREGSGPAWPRRRHRVHRPRRRGRG